MWMHINFQTFLDAQNRGEILFTLTFVHSTFLHILKLKNIFWDNKKLEN